MMNSWILSRPAEVGVLSSVFESVQPETISWDAQSIESEQEVRGLGPFTQGRSKYSKKHHLQIWSRIYARSRHRYGRVDPRYASFSRRRNRFCFAAFNILMPYPGTPLYERLKSEGRLFMGGQVVAASGLPVSITRRSSLEKHDTRRNSRRQYGSAANVGTLRRR